MSQNIDLLFILGTRPEIIKLAPVIRACEARGIPHTVVHSGQHYSEDLDTVFFEQLELPKPEYNLQVGSQSHGHQTGEMMMGIEDVIQSESPDIVLVQGDTNTVLAGAVTAGKMTPELGHVEAGLRSFDREMPEEQNRIVADHLADYLFAPTATSAGFLRDEGLDEDRIYVTGNTVVDAVHQNVELAAGRSTVLTDLDLTHPFGVMTAHRAENVDDAAQFAALLDGVGRVSTELGIEFIYPIHPRAENKIDEFGLTVPDGIRLVEPLDYLDFLLLEREASLILTDSGGVQEEACILGTPCVTMRDSTERPETLDVGANHLAGVEAATIRAGAVEMAEVSHDWENPFGDGAAAERILEIVCS